MPAEEITNATDIINDTQINIDDKNIIDKTLFFQNIYYLIKKNNLKITKLEEDLGVSAGYISRTSKEAKTKLNLDFAYNIAKILKVNLDTLMNIDLEKLNPNEEFILKFLEKLNKDTTNCVLNWKKLTSTELDSVEGPELSDYPIIEYGMRKTRNGNALEEAYGMGPKSHIFTRCSKFIGDTFRLRLKNSAYLYVCKLQNIVTSELCVEFSIIQPNDKITFLSNSYNSHEKLSVISAEIYDNIIANFNRPRFDPSVRNTIEAFMNDDFEDDPSQSFDFCPQFDQEIPF